MTKEEALLEKTRPEDAVCEPEDYRDWTEEALTRELERLRARIAPPDEEARRQAQARWSRIAKPLGSLGVLEEDVSQIAAITGDAAVSLSRRGLIIFCADNGVVAEGVTQTGQEVTAAVTAGITRGTSCSCLMARRAGADVFAVDVGIAGEIRDPGTAVSLFDRKIRRGTANFAKGAAMSRREALAAIVIGADLVRYLREKGYQILATGEMGIGNTTTSSAAASLILSEDPGRIAGPGAGLSRAGVQKKAEVIREGIRRNRPDPADAVSILSAVGGLDLAALAGAFLGGAAYRVPMVIDGFISAAAAALAVLLDGRCRAYLLASHVSAEPAAGRLMEYLGLAPAVRAGLHLGEGTGALTLFPLLDMALAVYHEMDTFSGMEIEAYRPL